LNVEVEESLIGSILLEGSIGINVIPEIRGIVRPDDFFHEGLRKTYTAMLNCDLPDIHGVVYELGDKLEDYDIANYYHYMASQGTSLEYVHLARLVAEYADKRRGVKRKRGYEGLKDG
jgi:replicative DNA helicase